MKSSHQPAWKAEWKQELIFSFAGHSFSFISFAPFGEEGVKPNLNDAEFKFPATFFLLLIKFEVELFNETEKQINEYYNSNLRLLKYFQHNITAPTNFSMFTSHHVVLIPDYLIERYYTEAIFNEK